MRLFTLILTLVLVCGCTKQTPVSDSDAGRQASATPATSLTHQQALDKVYGNLHSNSLKDSTATSLTHQQALDKVYGNLHSNSLKDSNK